MSVVKVVLRISALILFISYVQSVSAEEKSIDVGGTLTNANGNHIPNANITIVQGGTDAKTVRKAVSDKDGTFSIKSVKTNVETITYEASGYTTIEEREVRMRDNMDLSQTLQTESVGGLGLLLLLFPGVSGIAVYAVKKRFAEGENILDRFMVALVNSLIWAFTLAGLWYCLGLYRYGTNKLQLFHPSMTFEFYVPFLGFLGSLLYVFDLFRQGGRVTTNEEGDMPKGKEFGMRLIMGPYVAIVMVVLFTQDFSFINLTSSTGKGILAFFSGLLVVVALQGLIERGNEWLGRWRRKSGLTEIAEKFDLNPEDDNKLIKAGIRYKVQLRDCKDDDLREIVRKVGFDENLAVDFKRVLEVEQLRKTIGEMIWDRVKKINVKTIQDFALLTDASLEQVSLKDISIEDLKTFRDNARKFSMLQ
ncbi:MAG: carboxypeptidase regulatory-like domain-containing protein [Deltaproteobacteria bacterium]|nr:carboxypeptidase regulatory-like domain-containing protein [Deltaproteobacteria bacterium]MCP5007154.1 carboxypeptidase regulatory-like domain-containing protein [Planctomycetota bacterium]